MDESINTTNKNQSLQKLPLSVGRIVGEILAGMVIGITVAALVLSPILSMCLSVFLTEGWTAKGGFSGEFAGFAFFILCVNVFLFLIVYGPTAAVGVYIVGNIGKQTGSFLATLGGGLVGAFVVFIPSVYLSAIGKVILLIPLLLLLLIPPGIATLGFNLTRKYKKPPSSWTALRE